MNHTKLAQFKLIRIMCFDYLQYRKMNQVQSGTLFLVGFFLVKWGQGEPNELSSSEWFVLPKKTIQTETILMNSSWLRFEFGMENGQQDK